MRTIKFRGISKETGRKVFGYYLKSGADDQIFDGEYFHRVEPESVAQFISLDKHGEEIYEGDTVISELVRNDKARIIFFDKSGNQVLDSDDFPPVEETKAKFLNTGWSFLALKK